MNKLFSKLILVLVMMFGSIQSSYATLMIEHITDINGNLMGAKNVLVGNEYYDVMFKDGSCAFLFDGCDDIDDFFWKSSTDALNATYALQNLVFVDNLAGNFDSTPTLTLGLSGNIGDSGAIFTPFQPSTNGGQPSVDSAFFTNHVLDNNDIVLFSFQDSAFTDLTNLDRATFAIWSDSVAVNEPPIFLLFLVFISLIAKSRKNISTNAKSCLS